jgi:hypothetical protein
MERSLNNASLEEFYAEQNFDSVHVFDGYCANIPWLQRQRYYTQRRLEQANSYLQQFRFANQQQRTTTAANQQ